MENNLKQILVTGATGKTGSRVVQKLMHLGLPVRKGSRNANPPFDWENRQTWKEAFADIHSIYIAFQPDLAVPGAPETIQAFAELAKASGVKKLVLLSGRGEKEAQDCEQIIINSGLPWTIIRASWFNQNFSESYLLEPILSGHVALPAGAIKEPFVDVDDIADVAVAALTQIGHDGKIYEVTGSRLLSFKEAVEEIAAVTGKPIQYTQLSVEEYAAQLHEYQVPKEYIDLVCYLFTEVLDGRNASITNGVEEALGRKPTDFSDYVAKSAAAGSWKGLQ